MSKLTQLFQRLLIQKTVWRDAIVTQEWCSVLNQGYMVRVRVFGGEMQILGVPYTFVSSVLTFLISFFFSFYFSIS